jgi:hypothetical protein
MNTIPDEAIECIRAAAISGEMNGKQTGILLGLPVLGEFAFEQGTLYVGAKHVNEILWTVVWEHPEWLTIRSESAT